jgi:serine/threonine protein kinase
MIESAWNTRSPESKDLINKMMTFKYESRITANDAL